MSDIVERLRAASLNRDELRGGWLAEAIDEIERLRAENAKLRDRLFAMGAMNEPPCFACGYNGPGYFQPKQHACAARHHRAPKPGETP